MSGRVPEHVELVGPVASVDPPNSQFVVPDQTVDTQPETAFDGSLDGGLKVSLAGIVTQERGTETQRVAGAMVEAEGLRSADRPTLAAALVRFED